MFAQTRPFRRSRLAVGILLALSAAVLAGCTEEKAEAPAPVIRPVKVVEVAGSEGERKLDYSGRIRARSEMALGFRVPGKITERPVNIGDRVKAGDVLARIDPTDYRLSVETAKANLAAAERQVETAQSAERRARDLFNKNVASKSQLEEAENGVSQAASLRDSARSSLAQAENQVRYTDLTAVEDGIVTATQGEQGLVVAAGTPVVTVARDSEKEVQIAVPETEVSAFTVGKDVTVGLWSDRGLRLKGKVREVAGSADPTSRTFDVRISLPENDRVLLGMTAFVETTANEGQDFITIPLTALAEKDKKPIVWTVARESETVHARPVEVAEFADKGVRIASGLKPGDLVVAAGTQFMSENLQVKLDPEIRDAAAATPPADATASIQR
ncbi:RND family efflux transporter, MFP subunit [Rhizobium sp. RU20A]|uniref:efflux RND transporter periplasmic adaptor subunit n=1 Tax=Rhizobium sp. RU20A TaxID=1907412 RepID=UPI0009546EDE|nr:efflux RND transporter periplasmic adaptor subunit [Rhizobium sp. RU20A]SIQ97275.1 RND family efflux transporter, MFP subunit [Rhizobium sp. RU20A]